MYKRYSAGLKSNRLKGLQETSWLLITDEFSEEIKVEEKKETKKPTKTATGAKAAKSEAAKPEKEKDAAKQKTSKNKDKGEKSKVCTVHLVLMHTRCFRYFWKTEKSAPWFLCGKNLFIPVTLQIFNFFSVS